MVRSVRSERSFSTLKRIKTYLRNPSTRPFLERWCSTRLWSPLEISGYVTGCQHLLGTPIIKTLLNSWSEAQQLCCKNRVFLIFNGSHRINIQNPIRARHWGAVFETCCPSSLWLTLASASHCCSYFCRCVFLSTTKCHFRTSLLFVRNSMNKVAGIGDLLLVDTRAAMRDCTGKWKAIDLGFPQEDTCSLFSIVLFSLFTFERR